MMYPVYKDMIANAYVRLRDAAPQLPQATYGNSRNRASTFFDMSVHRHVSGELEVNCLVFSPPFLSGPYFFSQKASHRQGS